MLRPLTIASVNVNGVRAAMRRGLGKWWTQVSPDVVLLQEVRAPTTVLTEQLSPVARDWQVAHHESLWPGRAGVAVAAKYPILAVREGLANQRPDSAGRWIEVDLMTETGPLTVVSVYVHSATAETKSMKLKLAFLRCVTARLRELVTQPAVIGGDLNVARTERDIKNWKGNLGKSGFTPAERRYLTKWEKMGWIDTGRAYAGDVDGPYTWWSWRGRAYDTDTGWRIDYLWCSPGFADSITEVAVDRAPSYAERFSDHCPIRIRLAPPKTPDETGN